ncbi:hypothetical protein [Rhodococcoides fascians]|nr:hypothetical protein [Rhodococcus fascians]
MAATIFYLAASAVIALGLVGIGIAVRVSPYERRTLEGLRP